MKDICKLFLYFLLAFGLAIGLAIGLGRGCAFVVNNVESVWAQDIDDEEEQQPEPAKTVQEKIILPVQPPQPKPTPIQIEPIEPKPEQRQSFLSPQPIIAPEKEPVGLPGRQWFKAVAPVTAPQTQPFDPFSQQRFKSITPVTAPNYHNPYNPQGISSINFKPPSQVTGASSQYSTAILQDFRGGLNLVDFPNKIADNEATEQKNFIWSPAGKLEPRPGFDKYNMAEILAGYRIYGLYPYYQPDGKKILLSGAATFLFADTTYSGSGAFITVKTGLQWDKNYYFETFKGKVIVAHEGDYPFWYDGENTGNLGLIDTGTVIDSLNNEPSSCYHKTVIRDRFFENDALVGYIFSHRTSGMPAGTWQSEYIVGNQNGDENTDTIFTTGWAQTEIPEPGEKYKIQAFFFLDSLDVGTIDSSFYFWPSGDSMWAGCAIKIWDADKNWTGNQFYGNYSVLKLTSGNNFGRISHIYWGGTDHLIIGTKFGMPDTANFNGSTYTICRLGFLKPRFVKIYKNRIFFAGSEDRANLIYFSEYNDLNNFPPDNYFLVKTGGSDKVTTLATFYDDQLGYKDQSKDCLVIFKENSIYKLVWNSSTDYYLVQVADGVGCVAPRSIVNVEGKYLLFLHTTGVYAFDGRIVTLVSKKIQPTIDALSKNENIFVSAAGYHDRHYYLSYPTSGSGQSCTETIVFNVDLGSWAEVEGMKSNLYVQQTAIDDSVKLLFIYPAGKSFIYEFGNATTDTGEAISLVYKSKAFDFNSIADKKRFTYFDLDYYLTSGSFSAYFYTDFGDSLRYNKTVSDSGGYRYKRLPLDVDCLGRNFTFKITSSNHLELGKVGLKFKKIGE